MLKRTPSLTDHLSMPADAAPERSLQAERSNDSDREVCCSMTSVLLALVRKSGGERAVSELLQRATVDRDVAYLEGVHNWISLAEATALLEAAAQLTGDELFARKVGEHTLRQHAGTQVATLLRSLGSAEAVLQAVAQTASKLSAVTK